jgi:helicase SWR1
VNSTSSISAKPRGRASSSLLENTDIWEILASAKGKGKEKERSISNAPIRRKGDVSANEDDFPSIFVRRGDKSKARSGSVYADTHASLHDSKSVSAPLTRRLKRPSESISMNGQSSPRKRRKTDASVDDGLPFSNSAIPSPPGKGNSSRLRSSVRDLRPSVEKKTRMQPNRNASRLATNSHSHTVTHDVAEPSLKTNIKRIRLLVRTPPPSFSHPRQRPLPRKYDSLSAFLDSYMTLNDNDATPEMMEEMARKDAVTLERVDALRRQGRLLLGTDLLSSSPTPKRSPDQWDAVLESVVAYRSRRANGGKIVAKQIAQKIQTYWDGFAQREDKAKMQEEKRLRALAKSTLRAVIDQWKRAVMVSGMFCLSSYMSYEVECAC